MISHARAQGIKNNRNISLILSIIRVFARSGSDWGLLLDFSCFLDESAPYQSLGRDWRRRIVAFKSREKFKIPRGWVSSGLLAKFSPPGVIGSVRSCVCVRLSTLLKRKNCFLSTAADSRAGQKKLAGPRWVD